MRATDPRLAAIQQRVWNAEAVPFVVASEGLTTFAPGLNAELAKSGFYGKLDQKNVTAWMDLRNSAAHGKYGEYTAERVRLMIQSVRKVLGRVAR